MNESEFAELAAGHSLGSLSAEDERRYLDALVRHPEWTRIAEDDAATTARLAEGVPPVAPPPRLRGDLLARISVTPQDSDETTALDSTPKQDDTLHPDDAPQPAAEAAATPATALPRRRRKRLFALAACLVLIVGLGVGGSMMLQQALRPAAVVALDRIQNAPDAAQKTVSAPSGGTATAHWSTSVGDAVLVVADLPSLQADQAYELWFVRGETPVSAGVFTPTDRSTTVELHGDMRAGDVIAVTIERAGGSSTGAPTSTPIFVIPTSGSVG